MALCKTVYTYKIWPHFYIYGKVHTHSHKHTPIYIDICIQTIHTQHKSNKDNYKDKLLCLSLLSSLNDSAQRHELNLRLQTITPNAREGKKFEPARRESVSIRDHPQNECLVPVPQDFTLIVGSEMCVDLLFRVLQKKLLFTLIDSHNMAHFIILPPMNILPFSLNFQSDGLPHQPGVLSSPHPPQEQRISSLLSWYQCFFLPRRLLRSFP